MFNILSMGPREIAFTMFALITGMAVHEFGHALAAKLMGDDTPEQQGRLTLNPVAHISILGLISMLLIGFGWGRPVETDPRNYKNYALGELFVSFAGVIFNLITVVLSAVVLKLLLSSSLGSSEAFGVVTADLFIKLIQYNFMFILFNIIPIPPLDGAVIFDVFLKGRAYETYRRYANYGQFILLFLVFTGAIGFILGSGIQYLTMLVLRILGYGF